MFFLGSTGSVLPFVISLIALWSGFILGYGQYISLRNTGGEEKNVQLEKSANKSSNAYLVDDFSNSFDKKCAKESRIPLSIFHSPSFTLKIKPKPAFGIFQILCVDLPDNRGSPILS